MKLISTIFILFGLSFLYSCKSGMGRISQIEKGKDLFYVNCSSCHSSNMVDNLTGPALGGITKRRNKDWIYSFTRNSQKMIASGDKEALEISKEYHGMLMNSFEFLTDKELKAIYVYVEDVYQKNKNK